MAKEMKNKELKADALRNLSPEELRTKLAEFRDAQFKDTFKNTMRQLDNPLKLRETRRAIARMETILREHETGARKLGTH